MQTTKQRLTTLLAVLIAAIVDMTSLSFLCVAHADNDDYKEYKALYYVSDYENSDSYFNGFISQSARMVYPNIQLYHYRKSEMYGIYGMLYYFESIGYNTVRDSIIIFELRDGIPQQVVGEITEDMQSEYDEETIAQLQSVLVDSEEDLFTYQLSIIFEKLKDNGCKIMTILGTDDSKLGGNSGDFLQYADINVNLDVFTWLVYNYLYYIENNFDWDNLSGDNMLNLVFDDYLSRPRFFEDHLNPYMRVRLGGDVGMPGSYDDWSYFSQYINIFMPDIKSDAYTSDATSHEYKLTPYYLVPYSDASYFQTDSNNKIFPIAASNSDGNLLADWEDCVNTLGNNGYALGRVYYYNRCYNFYAPSFNNIYSMGSRLAIIDQWLPDIVFDFFSDADLFNLYNNYIGICAVSHVAIVFSGSGDGDEPALELEPPLPLECWQCVMNMESYLNYHGYLKTE